MVCHVRLPLVILVGAQFLGAIVPTSMATSLATPWPREGYGAPLHGFFATAPELVCDRV